MPFTFSHPAAVLPINNRFKSKFSLTGLALGSMAPDFEYFIRFTPFSTYGHHVLGFFILNLPLCFLLAYLFHDVLKNPLILHMPKPIDKLFSRFLYRPWNSGSIKKVLTFVYSALLGMLTHVVWDSFTHAEGVMVELIPILSAKIFPFGYSIPIFKLLQHGSSIIGILVILAYLYKKSDKKYKGSTISTNKKFLFFILTLLISLLLIFGIIYIKTQYTGPVNIGSFVVIVIDGIFLSLLVIALVSRSWIRDKKTEG